MNASLRKLLAGNRFAGLEAEILPQGFRLRLTILKRKGSTVSVERTGLEAKTVAELGPHMPKDIPLSLVFTGRGILHRRISSDPSADHKAILSRALPNATLADFYAQYCPASQDGVFVSVIRKDAADPLLEQLLAEHYSLVAFSIGPMACANLLPFLDEKTETILAGTQQLVFEDGKPAGLVRSEEEQREQKYSIGGQMVSSETLPAMGAAFQLVLPEAVRIEAEAEKLAGAPGEFLRRRLFKTGTVALLTTVLGALLLNFIFFSQYRSEAAMLEDRLQTEGGAFAEMQNLRTQLEGRRSFLQQAGLLGKAHYAWYADQLAKGMPAEIQLSQLKIAPRIKTAEEDTIGFRTGRLSIVGNCSESLVLNQWMKAIQDLGWVRTATLISYVQEKAMSKGEFEIEIELE